MEKIYAYNPDTCAYEEIKKPFMMHNLMLMGLMFTSLTFFILACYYHAQNDKTLALVPIIAKNCYLQVDSLKKEVVKHKHQMQAIAHQHYLMKNSLLEKEQNSQKLPLHDVYTTNDTNFLDYAYRK